MNILRGETISNKTRSYLSNIIDSHSPSWIREYICEAKRTKNGWKLCNTLGFFRNDLEFQDTFKDAHHLMFILVDINGEWDDIKGKYVNIYSAREKFNRFTKTFRSRKKGFHWDYSYGDPYTSNLHVFVFDMQAYGTPVKDWTKTLDKFDEGLYSQMFSIDELSKLTNINKTGNIWKTLIGNKDKNVLKERIKAQFGTVLVDDDVKHIKELDIKPLPRFEVLNWAKFNINVEN